VNMVTDISSLELFDFEQLWTAWEGNDNPNALSLGVGLSALSFDTDE
jgi:hypothetical protein